MTYVRLCALCGSGWWGRRSHPSLAAPCAAGMALATLFVTMPFVARELIPILEAMDMAQEEAARTLGASDFEVRLALEHEVSGTCRRSV
jgi:ABC-type sulfate transport system permease component